MSVKNESSLFFVNSFIKIDSFLMKGSNPDPLPVKDIDIIDLMLLLADAEEC